MAFPTEFSNLHDLARLPWFSVREGVLTLDPAVGPSIDVHTHLAPTFVMPPNVDLTAETPEVQHYLPGNGPFGFERYLNQYFSPEALRRMERDLVVGNFFGGGMRATHTAPNLAREMRAGQVAKSVLLPIDWPILSKNAITWMRAAVDRQELICFGSVHPLARNVAAKLDQQVALGARGIKMHPAVQILAPDHPKMTTLARLCGERKLPLFFHCGPVGIESPAARQRCQVDRYRAAIESCPDTTFVLGHSGALQPERAISFANDMPHVWLEMASQGLPIVEKILAEAPQDRICFGSDWPFYPQAIGLAKVLCATEGNDALRRAVLYGNAARLLRLSGQSSAPSASPSATLAP